MYIKPLFKRVCSKKKEFASKGGNSFILQLIPLQKGAEKHLSEPSLLQVYLFYLIHFFMVAFFIIYNAPSFIRCSSTMSIEYISGQQSPWSDCVLRSLIWDFVARPWHRDLFCVKHRVQYMYMSRPSPPPPPPPLQLFPFLFLLGKLSSKRLTSSCLLFFFFKFYWTGLVL